MKKKMKEFCISYYEEPSCEIIIKARTEKEAIAKAIRKGIEPEEVIEIGGD